jgi:hypothetical protein
MDNYYIDEGVPIGHKKGSFWWRNILKTTQYFEDITKVCVEDGHLVLF